MTYATEHIAPMLRSARETQGLSQRALSAMAGVPQSHISKIENGTVDLRVSSLVELARVLDLELRTRAAQGRLCRACGCQEQGRKRAHRRRIQPPDAQRA